MKRFRIMKRGGAFWIQERFLFFFWLTVSGPLWEIEAAREQLREHERAFDLFNGKSEVVE